MCQSFLSNVDGCEREGSGKAGNNNYTEFSNRENEENAQWAFLRIQAEL